MCSGRGGGEGRGEREEKEAEKHGLLPGEVAQNCSFSFCSFFE